MSDIKYWKHMAETWKNNAEFFLKEIDRCNWLYNELLKKHEELDKQFKGLQTYCQALEQEYHALANLTNVNVEIEEKGE